ncbi:MAG TPA: DNA translocase FtsK 4TM domain-containing protein [Gemmatimonadaceae bacterium]|nr:DNA translocase FtsK 4TM domain-containing protein [Gemmatimonadaceae bacterium]
MTSIHLPNAKDERIAHLKREILGIGLLLFAVFLTGAFGALGLAALRAGVSVEASVGIVGRWLAHPLVALFGWPAAVLIPLVPAVHALRLFGRLESRTDRSWMIFFVGLVVLLPVALALSTAPPPAGLNSGAAGLWGELVGSWWTSWFGSFGAWVVVVLASSVLTAATLAWNPVRALIGNRALGDARVRDEAGSRRSALGSSEKPTRKKRGKKSDDGGPDGDLALSLEPAPEEMPSIDPSLMAGGDLALAIEEASPDSLGPSAERRRKKKLSRAEANAEHDAEIRAAIDATEQVDLTGEELPSPELLSEVPPRNKEASNRELDAMGIKLMDALRTFRVEGELAGRTTGPVVSQFEVEPAPGVKVRQIANLSNDLALAMRAASIRIVAPIPGRGAVGVEVPNPVSEIVSFRELIEARDFSSARAALPIALGKDLEGKPVIADLAKMPHLLIAGATGSGKSVAVNTIITSLVYRHTPRTLRFLMVDPKMVELSVYNTLPHLRHKVITDNRDAASVLKWAVMEMNDRYELLAANGCRNIQEFNKRVQDGQPLRMPRQKDVAFEDAAYKGAILPYIVVIIDEMADLMMTVQGEVETPIAMLAQKARAIGIHLILATQRPSVNVITGLIKANFPSRIAFRVASQVDSRTIIDGAGAEMLLGNGDMLFIPPGKSEPSRLQGAYLSSEDTERLMQWYQSVRDAKRAAFAAQGLVLEEPIEAEPDILETVRAKEAMEAGTANGEGGDDAGDRDKLFREAAEVVVQNQQGSTSLLQRRLKVGYGRAARIIDQLHAAGVLGPPDGPKPRDVLVGLEDLDRICGPRA